MLLLYSILPINDLFKASINSALFIIGAINEIIANNTYNITKASNIPYKIPPNLSNCLITGNYAIKAVINFINISKILAIINTAIQTPALTIKFVTL